MENDAIKVPADLTIEFRPREIVLRAGGRWLSMAILPSWEAPIPWEMFCERHLLPALAALDPSKD